MKDARAGRDGSSSPTMHSIPLTFRQARHVVDRVHIHSRIIPIDRCWLTVREAPDPPVVEGLSGPGVEHSRDSSWESLLLHSTIQDVIQEVPGRSCSDLKRQRGPGEDGEQDEGQVGAQHHPFGSIQARGEVSGELWRFWRQFSHLLEAFIVGGMGCLVLDVGE